ncbi:hypothetical protein RB195_005181 [Necator americanus]|uniref:Uncharacterized protein n=1 Tax=Necator americanus TaxID=51031 RepID=A0ABR1BQH8_NECAM
MHRRLRRRSRSYSRSWSDAESSDREHSRRRRSRKRKRHRSLPRNPERLVSFADENGGILASVVEDETPLFVPTNKGRRRNVGRSKSETAQRGARSSTQRRTGKTKRSHSAGSARRKLNSGIRRDLQGRLRDAHGRFVKAPS